MRFRRIILRVLCFLVMASAMSTVTTFGVEDKGENKDSAAEKASTTETAADRKTTVEADETEIDFRAGKAMLTGNVKVRGPQMTVTADKMTVYFDENRNLTKVEAEKNVVIVQPDAQRKAMAGKAVYEVVGGVITLSDKPRLEMEEGVLENAEKIIYYRDSERVKSEGGSITFPSNNQSGGLNIFNRGQGDDTE